MKVELHKSVQKFVLRRSKKEQTHILNALYRLPDGDVKPLAGRPGEFRLRKGDIRAIFEYRGNVIFIKEIDNRGDAYR